jgi:hypothetical protein
MTPALKAEWFKYRSRFALRWLAEMAAAAQVMSIQGNGYSSLRKQIEASDFGAAQKDAMIGDAHLIEAAVEIGRRIASDDEEVRLLFRSAVSRIQGNRLGDVVWVNPNKADEAPIEWLEAGAPADAHRMLGSAH